jgi:glutathione synthase/RimK-type ligase-like ATP-grasp enzyme
MADGWQDDHPAARLLDADFRCWDDASVDWEQYDRVVIRSTWDYTGRPGDFLSWCERIGERRLRNSPALVAFNADKRYLGDLAVDTVPTRFIAPGDELPALSGEVVVKPSVSSGARDTGRFSEHMHHEARALIELIHASGRVALLQPYMSDVDTRGETSIVMFAGEVSHVLSKRAVLAPDEVAPLAEGELAPARAMLEEDLVVAGRADAAQLALAHELIAHIDARFGVPLYARVDMLAGADGRPLLIELEVIEPNLYLATAPGASERLAAAVRGS